ncbi:MAG: toll/interleukin-1 receptor domain-containing protein [Verrucomicrobia bacterium]|nr:toll/interleukin-1 receptor domain-containing protein [Verrucomicrobiota bacterium]
MCDVFISYSSDARPWAERLSESLERKGISTWTDFKNLAPAQRWVEELQDALDKARYFVILVGPEKRVGSQQDREWQGALKGIWTDPNKRIIPVLVGDATLPSFLNDWLSVRMHPGKPESSWIDEVCETIRETGPEESSKVTKRTARPDKALRHRLAKIERAAKQLKSGQEK